MRNDKPGQDKRPPHKGPPKRAEGGSDKPTEFRARKMPRPKPPVEGAPAEPMRIAKAMARAGLCSRRDAERWIEDGRVTVNNEKIASPALDVGPRDRIKVDGVELPMAGAVKLWRYYKPKGTVTTHRDPEGRPTVFEKLPEDLPRVISIGRLDFNTEGLLLLTNDGDLARFIELPATGWLRRYRVRANGSVTQVQLDALKEGIEIEGVRYGPVEATLDSVKGANVWVTIGLREGKNREVRKILSTLALEVNRLIRISFGPFQLMDLEEGKVEQVKRRVLADQLGPDLAKQFGLDVAPEDEGGKSAKNSGYRARPDVPKPEGERAAGPKRKKDDDRNARPAPRRFADRKPLIGSAAPKLGKAKRPDRSGRRDDADEGVSAGALAIRKALSGGDGPPRGRADGEKSRRPSDQGRTKRDAKAAARTDARPEARSGKPAGRPDKPRRPPSR
jgi:23S rRNA pseudouridine2605 synthase